MFKKYKIFLAIFFMLCTLFSACSLPESFKFPIDCNYILTSNFGYRSFDNSFHNGIDLASYEGTPVYAISNGIVTFSGFNSSGGNMIIIDYDNNYRSMYCHLASNILVSSGENVKRGEHVGYIGPKYLENGKLNGYTTGVHLHFSLFFNGKSIDPFSINYT